MEYACDSQREHEEDTWQAARSRVIAVMRKNALSAGGRGEGEGEGEGQGEGKQEEEQDGKKHSTHSRRASLRCLTLLSLSLKFRASSIDDRDALFLLRVSWP
eukprot:501297-Rhodomonas_salina.1